MRRLWFLLFVWLMLLCLAAPAQATTYVVGWGRNFQGQIGAGYKSNWQPFTPASTLKGHAVKQIAVGGEFSALLTPKGEMWVWGGDGYGELGNSKRMEGSLKPIRVPLKEPASQIALGGAQALALLDNGEVEHWGAQGCTPEGCPLVINPPEIVPGLEGIVEVVAKGGTLGARTASGHVYLWGENHTGEVCDGHAGKVSNQDVPAPELVPDLEGVKQVAIGAIDSIGGTTLFLMDDGTVMSCGGNAQGELGDGSTENAFAPVSVAGLEHVAEVSAGYHVMMARVDETAYVWGGDDVGQLGLGTAPEGCGEGTCSRYPLPLTSLHSVSQVSAGWLFADAVSNGRVFDWGWDYLGRLGVGEEELGQTERVPRKGAGAAFLTTPEPVEGTSEVQRVEAGYYGSLAIEKGKYPKPRIELKAGKESLTLSWRSEDTTEPWQVNYRVGVKPKRGEQLPKWTLAANLEPSARTYTITGLTPGVRYGVQLKSKALRSTLTVFGDPLS